jgi:hypothetical protein
MKKKDKKPNEMTDGLRARLDPLMTEANLLIGQIGERARQHGLTVEECIRGLQGHEALDPVLVEFLIEVRRAQPYGVKGN